MPRSIAAVIAGLLALTLAYAPMMAMAQAPPAGPPAGAYGPPAASAPAATAPAQGPSRPSMARRQQVPLPPRKPRAPFQLTQPQQAQLVGVLRAWEQRSAGIKTMWCDFARWDYDEVFGVRQRDPQNPNSPGQLVPKRVSKGQLKYAAPDKGLYRFGDVQVYDPATRQNQPRPEDGEHWVCDGQAIWEYNYAKRQLIERRLPPELQGQGIADGPLPFLFGTKADKLLARYFMRLTTPPTVQGQIWIEAYPKYQLDAANFQRATIILDQKSFLPYALEVRLPNGKSWHVHQFSNQVVNDPFRIFKGDFSKPSLPRGWQHIDETPPVAQNAGGAQRR